MEELTEEERLQRLHDQVRRERTGDPERGMMAPALVHPAVDPHAPLHHYADPRPRPSIAYDPLKDVEPEISVEEIDEVEVDASGEVTSSDSDDSGGVGDAS